MPNLENSFVGFGFGAIQSGLFLNEAYRADPTRMLFVAEVVPEIVASLRNSGGVFTLNIAHHDRVEHSEIRNIRIENPNSAQDRERLIEAIVGANEICTAVPSVAFYSTQGPGSIDSILAESLIKKIRENGPAAVIYTAENNNHAAEILESLVFKLIPTAFHKKIAERVQFLNTVIGKMSQVVVDQEVIKDNELSWVTPELSRSFLVESFNRILISKIKLKDDFQRGINVFMEKDDLLPFEEAKLYGHNATHALIGYLGAMMGSKYMAEIPQSSGILSCARAAFIEESGGALIHKYQGKDYLFSSQGYQDYADDLLIRMANPYLKDAIERVTRDPKRKLGWGDRLVGTIRLIFSQGIQPLRFAIGTAAALYSLDKNVLKKPDYIDDLLNQTWSKESISNKENKEVISLIKHAAIHLKYWQENGYQNLDSILKK